MNDCNYTVRFISNITSGECPDDFWTSRSVSDNVSIADSFTEKIVGGGMMIKVKSGKKMILRSWSLHQKPFNPDRDQQQLSLFLLQPCTGSKLSSMAIYPPYRRSQADHPPQPGRKDIRSRFCSRNTCHLQLLPLVQVHHRNDSSHLA